MNHTPGPWIWSCFGNGEPALMTPDRGRLIVMDAVRRGFDGARLRFAHRSTVDQGGILHELDLEEIQRHPDARLIAQAPALLRRLQQLVDAVDGIAHPGLIENARETIALATGEAVPA